MCCVSPDDSRFLDNGASDDAVLGKLTITDLLQVTSAETGDSLETANTERCCPENLSLALDALEADEALHEAVGKEIVDHFVVMKRAEWARYARAVTDWELREYLAFH